MLLVAHPSQSGAGRDGGGYSGSTDWQASVRAHLILEASDETAHTVPKPGGADKADKARAYRLRNAKQSYAPDGGHLWLVRHWRRAEPCEHPPELAWFGARAGDAVTAFEANEAKRAGRKARSISRKDGAASASSAPADGSPSP